MREKFKEVYEKCIKAQLLFEQYGGELVCLAQPHTTYELHFQEVSSDGLCFGFDTDDTDEAFAPDYLIPIDRFFKLAEKFGKIPNDVLKANCV